MLKLARIFQDYAVLQQNKPIRIFGFTDQEEVKVSLTAEGKILSKTACGKMEGDRFLAVLPPVKACRDALLTVTAGQETETVNHIDIGEVFLAGGQSNMEFLMRYEAEKEKVMEQLTAQPDPDVRYFEVPKVSYEGQLQDEDHSDEGIWRIADRENILYFSAVGYYFARYIKNVLNNVPVGIIGCTWGGSSAAAWLDESYMNNRIQPYYDLRHKADNIDLQADFARYKDSRKTERSVERRKQLDEFMTRTLLEPMKFQISPEMHDYFMRTKYAPFSPFRPCGLYHTMVKTVIPYTLAGFIWYQGEEDCITKEYDYTALQEALIQCWRDSFYEELPFILAQLPIFKDLGGWNGLDYVPIRRQQEEITKQMNNVYMAITADKGLPYEIHPKEKRAIGERMALLALGHIYGKNIVCDSPEVSGAQTGEGQVSITFLHADNGLKLHGPDTRYAPDLSDESLKEAFDVTVNGVSLSDFEVETRDNEVLVRSDKIKQGSRVKIAYGQKGVFCACLYNTEELPVRPFEIQL